MYVPKTKTEDSNISEKSWLVTFILCFFFSCHRFYVGKIGTGIIWLFTGGGCLVGTLWDFIKICRGEFQDKKGKYIVR